MKGEILHRRMPHAAPLKGGDLCVGITTRFFVSGLSKPSGIEPSARRPLAGRGQLYRRKAARNRVPIHRTIRMSEQ